jgi:hypothetical protein
VEFGSECDCVLGVDRGGEISAPHLANPQNRRDTIPSPTPGAPIRPSTLTDKPAVFRLVTLGRLALINEHGDHLIPPESARLLGTLAYLESSPARPTFLGDLPSPVQTTETLQTDAYRLPITDSRPASSARVVPIST